MDSDAPAGRGFEAGDLLGGEDHDFVVNLYLGLLRRWPDPAGYQRYHDLVAGRPERRLEALREVAASDEAVRSGTRVAFGAGGGGVPPGPIRALAIRSEWLQQEVVRLQAAIGLLGNADLTAELIEARDAALHFELNALRREVADRLDGLLGPAGPAGADAAAARDAALDSVARLVAGYAGDLVAAAEARVEVRLRAMEARLLALGAHPGA